MQTWHLGTWLSGGLGCYMLTAELKILWGFFLTHAILWLCEPLGLKTKIPNAQEVQRFMTTAVFFLRNVCIQQCWGTIYAVWQFLGLLSWARFLFLFFLIKAHSVYLMLVIFFLLVFYSWERGIWCLSFYHYSCWKLGGFAVLLQ